MYMHKYHYLLGKCKLIPWDITLLYLELVLSERQKIKCVIEHAEKKESLHTFGKNVNKQPLYEQCWYASKS
jgi:hypothetical protein